MSHSFVSRVSIAAQNEKFGIEGCAGAVQPTAPVSCTAAATVLAGVATAFLAGAAIVEAHRYFGGRFDSDEPVGGSSVIQGSVDTLVDTRMAALAG